MQGFVHPYAMNTLNRVLPNLIAHGADRVIVFGSATRWDEFGMDSDIDIAVVGSDFSLYGIKLNTCGKPVDILTYSSYDEICNSTDGSVEHSILLEGVTIWETKGC